MRRRVWTDSILYSAFLLSRSTRSTGELSLFSVLGKEIYQLILLCSSWEKRSKCNSKSTKTSTLTPHCTAHVDGCL